MHRLEEILVAASMIMAAGCSGGEGAYTYEVTYGQSGTGGNEIRTEEPYVRIGWEATGAESGPYEIVQVGHEGDTVMRAETPMSYIVADLSGDDGSRGEISIRGKGDGVLTRVGVAYRHATNGLLIWCVIAGIVIAGGIVMFHIYRRQRRKLAETQHELENASVRHTRKFDFATVLFADIQGFTKIAEHMNPDQLVDELDRYFIYFDDLVDKYGVEKIKTIGDAYMCAGGVPDTDSANPIEVCLVGLEMIAYVQERRASKDGFWNIRVGINTGPVISAQLGHIKKVFDIWGDSVNTASRMESSSEPGRVNVSGSTYQKIQDYFECEHRGRMPVKYKGEVDMYFVTRLKPEYCLPGSTCRPNALLMRKLQILKISDFEQHVADTAMRGAHANVQRRMDMFLSRVRTLANMEGMKDDDVIVANVAAILCFVQEESIKDTTVLSRASTDDLMRRLHLTQEQRDRIYRVVNHIAQYKMPEDIVEEVIYDSFNEVFGRKDIVAQLLRQYEDVSARGTSLTRSEWMSNKRRQLTDFAYYTDSAKKLCEVPKKRQIEILDTVEAL